MTHYSPPGKECLPREAPLVDCDQSSRDYLLAAFLRQIKAIRSEVEGVRRAEDIECIHRMRVASRRARNLLPLMSGCVGEKRLQSWSKQLRGITRALGMARDTDVQLDMLVEFEAGLSDGRARPGIRRLLLRLRQLRTVLQAELLRVLSKLEKENGLQGIEEQAQELTSAPQSEAEGCGEAGQNSLTPSHLLYRRAAFFVQRCLDDLLVYEPYIHDPTKITELHAMRISAKHLRYTLETFGPLYGDGLLEEIRVVRKVQESLGTIHDCDVWAATLPAFLDEERARMQAFYGHLRPLSALLPGLNLFAQGRAELRAQTYEDFVRQWEKGKRRPAQGMWEALRQRVNQPLLPQQMYPPPAEANPNA